MISYKKAIELLTSKDKFYIDLGLDRIKTVLNELGNPQDNLKYIHVAGTNGKGSVCAMLESILRTAGYKTGLYTSPHIWEYTERIKVCGVDISQEKFAELTEIVNGIKIHLTEFEILTVIMFLYFNKQKVDVVILETGMGGRLDATNVIEENLCSIITQIDLDHTDRLGKTKDEIAFEKAGIIKKNCPLITGMGYEAIRDKADDENSMLIFVSPFVTQEFLNALALKGLHQAENLSLVLTAIQHLFKDISDKQIIEGLKQVKHPCRFEFFADKNLIIDASHNPNGIQALRTNLDYYYPNQERRFIFGALKNKNYEKMMQILFREGDEIFLNGFDYPNACTFEELKDACTYKAQEYKPDKFIYSNDKLNIICGSFYMIGQMKI